jgi:hypothetical protein
MADSRNWGRTHATMPPMSLRRTSQRLARAPEQTARAAEPCSWPASRSAPWCARILYMPQNRRIAADRNAQHRTADNRGHRIHRHSHAAAHLNQSISVNYMEQSDFTLKSLCSIMRLTKTPIKPVASTTCLLTPTLPGLQRRHDTGIARVAMANAKFARSINAPYDARQIHINVDCPRLEQREPPCKRTSLKC